MILIIYLHSLFIKSNNSKNLFVLNLAHFIEKNFEKIIR